jgi:hypothetical protein
VALSSAWGDAVARPRDDRQKNLLRPALEEVIDLGHALVRLAREIDWGFSISACQCVHARARGSPGRRRGWWRGLFILKHMHNPSDEVLCDRWLENPYYIAGNRAPKSSFPAILITSAGPIGLILSTPCSFFTDDYNEDRIEDRSAAH